MNCAWVQERLLLYQAGELGAEPREQITRHLERCPRCTAMAEALAETQEQVETALPTIVEAPASLDERVMAAVRSLPPPRRLPRFAPWGAGMQPRLALVAAACCLMLASFGAGEWHGAWRQYQRVAAARTLDLALLGGAHLQYLAALNETPAVPSEPRRVAGELKAQLPFAVGVVDSKSDGLRLLSGSLALVDSVPVAALRYDWKGERISLFQMPSRALSPPALGQVVRPPDSYFVKRMGGLTYVTWSFGETKCVMVARAVPMHLLFQLACHTSEKLERA